MESGVHSSLSSMCHHEIVFAKLNLKVEYPSPYERVFWDYSRADKVSINRAINAIEWYDLFANKPVESQVSVLNNLLLNIRSNYIPYKTVLCDDNDPPWMTNGIRAAIKMKNNACKEYIRSGMRHNYYVRLEDLTTEFSNLIHDTKTEYHLVPVPKTYWSILKTFTNGRKVPVIPPLLINNEFISNFKTKANYFNRLFNQQCTVISTDSSIPSSVNLATNETVTKINFDEQLISKLVVALNPNKAHDHDGLSILMLQISKTLSILFWNCLKDVAPVHKKTNKQILDNYRPVSLLPICSKLFEKIVFDTNFQHLTVNKLLNPNQSGLMPGDSFIYQLISITDEIYTSFDANPSLEVRGVFLDISKAFVRVLHERLIYKIKCTGVKGDLLALIESFLFERLERVVLNGQESEWLTIKAGVPQGSVLSPLFIYIYTLNIYTLFLYLIYRSTL